MHSQYIPDFEVKQISEILIRHKIDFMIQLRSSNEHIVKPFAEEFKNAQFFAGNHPWEVKCDIAIPCATQNELNLSDAKNLIKNNCICICEGANMPCTPEAIDVFQSNKILYCPGKAANAGGVATSGLEMTQNAMKLRWPKSEVDQRLHQIMESIHEACSHYGRQPDGYIDYVKGANIAGFLKVANAMIDQGIV